MKDWSDLEEKYQDMRLADPKAAQSFKQRMTARFQVCFPPYLYPFLALPSTLHYLVPSANKCLPPTYLHLSPSSLLFSASFWLFLSLSHALSLSISLSL